LAFIDTERLPLGLLETLIRSIFVRVHRSDWSIGNLLDVPPGATDIRITIWLGRHCEFRFFSSKNGGVDLGDTFVPDLAPHVSTPTSASV